MVRLFLTLFGRSRPLSLSGYAFGYRRTMDHLRSWPLALPKAVKKAEVSVSMEEDPDPLSPHQGTRLFVCENIPQLKYHNPSVQVNVEECENDHSKIIFHSEDGGREEIVTTGLRQKDIKHKIETFSQQNKV